MDVASLLQITAYEGIESPLYTNLPNRNIRLLRLLPGGPDDELTGMLFQSSLDENPKYTALSYAWGRSVVKDQIINLNGCKVQIKKNLWRFLHQARALRTKEPMELLWIDAICINQANESERLEQVSLMPHVYKTAEQVLAWLGPAYCGSDIAMLELARHLKRRQSFTKLWSSPAGSALCDLCGRPYWKRLWIFQELVLARRIKLMCGDKAIPWEAFQRFLLGVRDCTPAQGGDAWQCKLISSGSALAIVEQTMRFERASLWDLMHATKSMKCTESKDKVFALLGVATQGTRHVRPDYTITMPVLLNQVLRSHHEGRLPRTIEEVDDQVRRLASLGGIDPNQVFAIHPSPGQEEMQDMRRYPLTAPGQLISLWWTFFYGHTAVRDILSAGDVLGMDSNWPLQNWYRSKYVVRLLLDWGKVDMNEVVSNHRNALCAAAEEGLEEVVDLLLQSGKVDVTHPTTGWNAAVHFAAKAGKDRVLGLLLNGRETLANSRGFGGSTAPHLAVTWAGDRSKKGTEEEGVTNGQTLIAAFIESDGSRSTYRAR